MVGNLELSYITTLKDRVNFDKLQIYQDQSKHRASVFIKTKQHQIEQENPIFRRMVDRLPNQYEVESHVATTDDGFLLKMFRVKPNKELTRVDNGQRPAVLLQHGLLSCSETFVNDGENSWASKLVDAGFDVWVANSRGTVYSKGHTNLIHTDQEYYDYSFYEMGKYDTPAMVDYILDHT